ncbi:MAG TPA: hypothetical protein V6D47_06320 [Oscillatoriaceae cyanobacterium]
MSWTTRLAKVRADLAPAAPTAAAPEPAITIAPNAAPATVAASGTPSATVRQADEPPALIRDPAAYLEAHRRELPAELVGLLEAIARVWELGSWQASTPGARGDAKVTRRAESQRREFSRLVHAYHQERPADVPAWLAAQTARYSEHAQAGDRREPKPARWGETMAQIAQLINDLEPADLPASFELRPGVTVKNGGRFLASLKADLAKGPNGIRARRGLLWADLGDLRRAVAEHVETSASTDAAGNLPPRREGMTPAEHLAELGGYAGAFRLAGDMGPLLWDAARLWERDHATDRAARWEAQYWTTWAKAMGAK